MKVKDLIKILTKMEKEAKEDLYILFADWDNTIMNNHFEPIYNQEDFERFKENV